MSDENLTEREFVEKMFTDMMKGWVPLRYYFKLYPTETRRMVEARVQRGHWKRRIHYFAPAGSEGWVCLPAIQRWASGQESEDGQSELRKGEGESDDGSH